MKQLFTRLAAVCCASVLVLTACGQGDLVRMFAPRSYSGPRAEAGVLDLRGVDLSAPVPLDGQWLFYPGLLLEPEDVAGAEDVAPPIEVPAVWNQQPIDGRPLGAHGFGTYRLDLLLDAAEQPHFLRASEISTAFRLYADGSLVLQAGEVGSSRADSRPEWATMVRRFVPRTDRVTLLVQVSNFHHARGGIRDEILISRDYDLHAGLQARRNFRYLVFGALLIMGIYHIGLITVSSGEYSTLWFGMVSLLMALRSLLTGQPALIHASTLAMWEFLMTLEYLAMYAGVVLFFLYTRALFPEEMHRTILRAIKAVGGALVLVTLVTPTRVFSATLYGFHVIAVLACIYLVFVALSALRAGRAGAGIYAVGMTILWLAVLNDVLYNLGVLRTGYIADAGLLVFLFFQSLVLAKRSAANVRRIEELLQERNRLEGLTYRDGLTGISNRRHFDVTYAKEWTRAQRHSQPLSIIMVDIDAFKPYNDNYGHLQGDSALTEVAHVLLRNLHRSSDFVARYGGEEFAVILPATDREGAIKIAEMMRAAIEELNIEHRYSDSVPVLTASFGVGSMVPHRDADSKALLREADEALYLAKQRCKNCVA